MFGVCVNFKSVLENVSEFRLCIPKLIHNILLTVWESTQTCWWPSSKFHCPGIFFFCIHWKQWWGIFVRGITLNAITLFWNHALFLLNLAQLLDRQFSAEFELYDYLLVFICGFFFSPFGSHMCSMHSLQLQGYLEFPFFPMIYSAQAQDCYSSQMDRQNHTWQSSQKLHLLLAGLLRLYSDEMELSQIMDSLSQPAPLLGKELDNFLGVLNHQV